MAYDASFLTGSHERPVDPISTGYLHNDQEISELENGHTILVMDGNKLNLAIESFDQNIELGNMLHQNIRRGQVLSASMYRILNLELKQTTKRSSVAFDPLPAMESLDHMHPRELVIAMENVVTDTIKSIWETIKNTFINLHNKIKTWYIKAWDGSARLMKQAEALKAKAEGMAASSPRETSFEMSGVKFLNINGKIPSPQDIGKGVAEIEKISSQLLTTTAEKYTNLFPKIEEVLKEAIEQARHMKDSDASTPDPNNPPKQQSIGDAFNGAGNNAAAGSTSTDSTGNTVTLTGKQNKLLVEIVKEWEAAAKACNVNMSNAIQNDTRFEAGKIVAYRNPLDLLGSIMLVAAFPVPPDAQTIESYGAFKAGFKISPEPILAQPKEVDDNGTFQTAQTALVVNICENVMSACDVFLKYKLLYDARDKATGNLMKQMEGYVSANSNLKGPGQKHMNNSISATVACVKKMNDGETRWSKYAMSVLNKAIVYCRTSLNQY